jgi:hypothetical protein
MPTAEEVLKRAYKTKLKALVISKTCRIFEFLKLLIGLETLFSVLLEETLG